MNVRTNVHDFTETRQALTQIKAYLDRMRTGTAVLVGGTKIVPDVTITANTVVLLTCQVPGGTPGFLRVSARTPGASFTITSSSGTDTSTVGYLLIEP